MKITEKVTDEKLQYDIKRTAAKISALSSRKIDKYQYLTSERIFSAQQHRTIEQTKFTYSPLGKALKNKQKQLTSIEKDKLKH